MAGKVQDSSFVVITGPPQQDKRKRISYVRSQIRKSRLRPQPPRHRQQKLELGTAPPLESPSRQLTKMMDLSWLPVSEAVCERLKYFFRQYIESSAYLHPFFRSVIPAMVVHVPLMSAKLVNATTWDDLNSPNCKISDVTLFQRGICEKILSSSTADPETAISDTTIISMLTILSFELVNGDEVAYVRYKNMVRYIVGRRGGMDKLGFDGNLKTSLLLFDRLEKVIKGFAESSPSLASPAQSEDDKYKIVLVEPTDFKIFTFQRGQRDFWQHSINISTIRLLSDFFQLVGLAIRYQQSSECPVTQQRIWMQWHFLRNNLISLKSTPFRYETQIDRILVHSIALFVSDGLDMDESVNELRSILCESNVDAYYGPLPGALIWCLVVGSRKSPQGSIRKWFLMQLTRITCPSALDDPVEVSKNLDMIIAGLDATETLHHVQSTV